jgi:hypothetical protein
MGRLGAARTRIVAAIGPMIRRSVLRRRWHAAIATTAR